MAQGYIIVWHPPASCGRHICTEFNPFICQGDIFDQMHLCLDWRLGHMLHSIDQMVRVFANSPRDHSLIPGRVIPKTKKMVLDATLLNTHDYKVRIKGKWSNPGNGVSPSTTLDYSRQLYFFYFPFSFKNTISSLNLCVLDASISAIFNSLLNRFQLLVWSTFPLIYVRVFLFFLKVIIPHYFRDNI